MKLIAKDVTVADVNGLSDVVRRWHARVQSEAERAGHVKGLKQEALLASLVTLLPLSLLCGTGHVKIEPGNSAQVMPAPSPLSPAGGWPASLGTSGDPRDAPFRSAPPSGGPVPPPSNDESSR